MTMTLAALTGVMSIGGFIGFALGLAVAIWVSSDAQQDQSRNRRHDDVHDYD